VRPRHSTSSCRLARLLDRPGGLPGTRRLVAAAGSRPGERRNHPAYLLSSHCCRFLCTGCLTAVKSGKRSAETELLRGERPVSGGPLWLPWAFAAERFGQGRPV
jgi:hypothetical protein